MTDSVTPLGDHAGEVRMNVGAVPLDQLLSAQDSALAAVVQRLLDDIDRPGENYAAFGNAP
jgi:FXSXX-COOH protein